MLLFKIGDASGERKYLISASNLTEGTNGKAPYSIPMVLLVNMHLIKET